MSPVLGILIFLIMFAVVMMAVSLGSRFLELRSKQQVESLLNTGPGADPETRVTTILVDSGEPGRMDTYLGGALLQSWIQTQLQQGGVPWAPSHLVFAMLVGGFAGGLLGWVIQPLGFALASAVALGGLLGSAPLLFVRHKRAARLRALEEQLPEALDFLARSMRAGHAFSISLEMLGSEQPDPLGQEFRALFAEHNLGAPIEVALANFGRRVPLLDVRLFISSVSLQRQTGGNLSEVLTRLAFLIRERFRLRGQVRAASAHGKMTSMVLTALPIVMIFALQIVAPDYLPQMVRDPDGRWMIVAAVVFQILGYIIMRRITNIKV
jgi:tight adherence protein B